MAYSFSSCSHFVHQFSHCPPPFFIVCISFLFICWKYYLHSALFLSRHASSDPGSNYSPSKSVLLIYPSIPLFSAPPWHSSLSLVLSSQTHGFNFGLPASLSPAILYLVSSQAFACICVRMCDDHIMNVCAPKRHLKLIIKLYIVNKGLVAFQT